MPAFLSLTPAVRRSPPDLSRLPILTCGWLHSLIETVISPRATGSRRSRLNIIPARYDAVSPSSIRCISRPIDVTRADWRFSRRPGRTEHG